MNVTGLGTSPILRDFNSEAIELTDSGEGDLIPSDPLSSWEEADKEGDLEVSESWHLAPNESELIARVVIVAEM